jgi:hypothetical protein
MSSIIKVNTYQDANGNALFSSDGSGNVTTSATGLQNTPSFFAYLSSNQSLTDNTNTKAQVDTEIFDTDNCYDNSTNYRFTPTVAGKYFIFASGALDASASNFASGDVNIFKNGIRLYQTINNQTNNNANQISLSVSAIDEANGTTDYYEFYLKCDDSSGNPTLNSANRRTFFGAYRIIGA